MKEVRLIINQNENSRLYIDGVWHGTFKREEVKTVASVLKTLYARDAISNLVIIEGGE